MNVFHDIFDINRIESLEKNEKKSTQSVIKMFIKNQCFQINLRVSINFESMLILTL